MSNMTDPNMGETKEIKKIGSIICLLEGDQTKCWVQKLKVIHSALSLEEAKLIFEIYNIAAGEYARSEDETDISYSGLYGLDDEILEAREKMKNQEGILDEFTVHSDEENPWTIEGIIEKNPERYGCVKKYLEDCESIEDIFTGFDFEPVKEENFYWIDLCQVTQVEYERYTSELHHIYNVAELFKAGELPVDLKDAATVSIFGTGKFEAFADLSYGC